MTDKKKKIKFRELNWVCKIGVVGGFIYVTLIACGSISAIIQLLFL